MARSEDSTSRAQRLTPLLAVGALASATALAFGRVFVGRLPTLELIAAALLAVAVGWATARRGLLVATLASLVGLAFALTWLVFPQTSWYGLPTLRTLRAVGRSLEYVGQQTRAQASPTPALPPLMLAAMTAVWAASSSAYTLAARAGSPMLAVLPPVALVAFADIVLEDGVRPVYAVLFLLAALAVVFSDGLRRVRQWGPVWSGPYEGRALRSATGRGLRRVALVAIAAAVLVPGALPGFRAPALVDFSGTGGSGVRLDPLVSIHASLQRDEPLKLFQVRADEGSYWRVLALDEFDGSDWTMSDQSLEGASEYSAPARFPALYPADSAVLEQRFHILTDLGDRWIPMAYPAETLTYAQGGVRYDAGLGVAMSPDPLQEGTEYEVVSRRVQPTPEQLDAVTFGDPAQYGRYTFLPGDVPPEVREIALRWAGDARTPYRQIFAIQRHLHGGAFTYSQDVEPRDDAQAIVRFLTQTQTGFCQQYATAMAVLVRELGYPARVAVGYRPGDLQDGVYTVSTDDAHAWVEVLFPGYGWLPFEPTPGPFANPLAEPGTYLNRTAPTQGGSSGGTEGAETPGGNGGGVRGLPPKLRSLEFLGGRRRGGIGPTTPPPLPAAEAGPGYSIPYRRLLEILLLGLTVLAIAIPLGKLAWRSRTLHRRREPRELVLAAYRVFDGEAADLGLARRTGETLAEYHERVSARVSFSNGHLGTLTRATERAAYASSATTREEAEGAVRAARTAIRDMRRSAGLLRRVTGIFRPGL
jgi:transglutaminase-like putative cysteine protease